MTKKTLSGIRPETMSYTLVGITSPLNDYRLTFHLNSKAGFHLSRTEDFVTACSPDGATPAFPLFHDKDEDRFLQFFLLPNRAEGILLFTELKTTDYLLLIDGPIRKTQTEKILKMIRTVPNIVAAFEIPFSQLKNYQAVITDLELHFMRLNRDKNTPPRKP